MFWSEWIKVPLDMMMSLSGIGSKNTYYKAVKDLKEWGFIDYIPGKNQQEAARFHVIRLPKNGLAGVPATEPATDNPTELLTELLTGKLRGLATEPVYKLLTNKLFNLLTNNLKTITDGDFDFFIKNNKEIQNTTEGMADELKHLWDMYIDMRAKKGKPLETQQGKEKTYQKLKELAGGKKDKACKILEQSIANEWILLRNLQM